MQLGFIGFGPLRAIVGRRRWYCEMSGKPADGKRDHVRCPRCGLRVRVTTFGKFGNHGRATTTDGRKWN